MGHNQNDAMREASKRKGRLRAFFAENYGVLASGPARSITLLHLLDSIGGGVFLASAIIYFVRVADLPADQVGIALSCAGLAGFLCSVPIGRLADRVGARPLLTPCLLALAVLYALYPFVHTFPMLVAVLSLVGAVEWGSGPLFHKVVAEAVTDAERVTVRAALRSVFNMGFAVGALLAAGMIAIGALQALPLANALSFLLAAAASLRIAPLESPAVLSSPASTPLRALRNRPFLAVVVSSALLALNGTLLIVGVPLWLVQSQAAPTALVPLVFVVNTVLIAVFQVRTARGSSDLRGAVRAARYSGAATAVACVVLGIARGPVVVPFAFVSVLLLTLGELWQSASAFGLSYGLAPKDAQGEYLAAFHLHTVAQATLGPALVTAVILRFGTSGLLLLAVVLCLGTVLIGSAVSSSAQQLGHPVPDRY